MKSHASNSLGMCVQLSLLADSLIKRVEFLRQIWVGSSVLRPWSILALNFEVCVLLASQALLLDAGVNLLLDLGLVILDLFLDVFNFLDGFVLIKLQESFLFDGLKVFLLNFFNLLFVVLLQVLHLLDV